MPDFQLVSPYKPMGDQPRAIEQLVSGYRSGMKLQTLMGVTGSGKTFTMANLIREIGKPALVIAHNKTLAAQLYAEFKELFPNNAVGYYVSFYDYYQPEAYIASTDSYIESNALGNGELNRLRHEATSNLVQRRDTIIVSSVSCIYGLGSPVDYQRMCLTLKAGEAIGRDDILLKLVTMQYVRNNVTPSSGSFRVRGDVVEIMPIYGETLIRIELFGDMVERIAQVNALTGEVIEKKDSVAIYPATHYITSKDRLKLAEDRIMIELDTRLRELRDAGFLVEAQRLEQRTRFDLEMIQEIGYCTGMENYSRHLSLRSGGETPATLLDYFPEDFLMLIDESHVTIPQIGGMYAGDRSRKETLVRYGFRLPSALDNRPLDFGEFERYMRQVLFVSATPGGYERRHSEQIVEQVIRPTGLVDPEVDVKPVEGQIDHLLEQIRARVVKGDRTLITTLTKRMAEDLTVYLSESGIKVRYLHSEVDALERVEILRDLRVGKFDALVGINLLREGLDLPEVSLVAILDADKEGFLRSETSLIQTIGRAARNVDGKVILYADRVTDSMRAAIDKTNWRRAVQIEYNHRHGIVPATVRRAVRDTVAEADNANIDSAEVDIEDVEAVIGSLEKEMRKAAKQLEFEKAAALRDEIGRLKAIAGDRIITA